MAFDKEADFEAALISLLTNHGWEKEVLRNPTEQQLIRNWADILFQNNRGIDRLNDYPLTDGEMQQILEQITGLRTPLKLNSFINGKTVTIIRDNPDDAQHFGREIPLKIYDRLEIAAGQSRYQIAQQPKFPTKSKLLNDRRGDLMLLINGMPVIHIELKKSGVPVSQACNQIEKYAAEGIFTGLFALVQVFFAMNPEDTVYFANPGPDGKFNPDFFFHWADFYNNPVNDWKSIASDLLSIPRAHQLIGFYTVADDTDGILKVMRSYQIYAADKISDKVAMTKWELDGQRGGYIWHTTGSGKTMTSFKSAQLIAASKNADKVIFLIDRIELGTQSLKEYKGFAEQSEEIQATENTDVLVSKLASTNPADTLIVTSIQKMSNIGDGGRVDVKKADLAAIQSKRIVFIVDECHRSVFGENMMPRIKRTFPRAIFFGFSGTPIQDENQKKGSVTATIFGNELHKYSIADGIRDKNVLGFDPYKVLTYKDADLRQKVALEKAKADTVQAAIADPKKSKVFYEYMSKPMAGHRTDAGEYVKGIEDYIPNSQYERLEHQKMVVQDIKDNWLTLSRNGKFHAIFATSSIPEAIQYYELIKAAVPDMKVTALFDPSIDNNGNGIIKEDGLKEIILDYNTRYGQTFTVPTFAKMKKDISNRLAHKRPYTTIEKTPEQQIDLLIVVDQMLTGFDSKWINALYMDKVLQYENIIQAFSRTNRLFGPEKPFGIIRYYRRPHTMERLIDDAVKLYSEDKPLALFVERLDKNIEGMNFIFGQIQDLFEYAGVEDFANLPPDVTERKKFADLFVKFNEYLEAAKVQGFVWNQSVYEFNIDDSGKKKQVKIALNEVTYKILVQRYKELFTSGSGAGGGDDVPYDIAGYLIAIDTEKIDVDYMNSRFAKYMKLMRQQGVGVDVIQQAKDELHKTFASLTVEEQKFANIFLHDIQSGDVEPEDGKMFRDYITEYMTRAKDDQIHRMAVLLGLDEDKLRSMMDVKITDVNINEFGRFDALKATADKQKAKAYFEKIEGTPIIPPKVPMKIDKLLRAFIIRGGFDIE
ncbi:MAG: HsdR family type I site-specific deoxyribonuclease [Lachnospiraceae bacterium]|nr:HsdR family type I site-specific deoxyribonuclease [Lachnospiraceae bacterium]